MKTGILVAAALVVGLVVWRLTRPPAVYRVAVLPSLGGLNTHAERLNDLGQVVGIEYMGPGDCRLFLRGRENGMRDLGPAAGKPSSAVF